MRLEETATAALPPGFLGLPPIVYANEPMWVPEDGTAVERAFSAANPWFEDGESAAFCIPDAARLATFVGPDINNNGERAAYFGFWETVGDAVADDALFARAESWAKERGAKWLCGPINFSTYGKYRLRLSAESDGYTFANEPFNPAYYPAILDRLGFDRQAEALTQLAPGALAAAVAQTRMPKLEAVRDRGIRVEAFAHDVWLERLPELYQIVDAMFGANWGYAPISYDVFERMCGEKFIRKTCPNTSTVAFDQDDNIIGFFLVYPHWGPLIVQQAGERRVTVDELDYATHWPQLLETGTVMAVSKTSATHPEWQKQGIFTALTVSMFQRGESVFSHWYGALIGAEKFNRRYGDGLADDSRWYAVYGKDLSGS